MFFPAVFYFAFLFFSCFFSLILSFVFTPFRFFGHFLVLHLLSQGFPLCFSFPLYLSLPFSSPNTPRVSFSSCLNCICFHVSPSIPPSLQPCFHLFPFLNRFTSCILSSLYPNCISSFLVFIFSSPSCMCIASLSSSFFYLLILSSFLLLPLPLPFTLLPSLLPLFYSTPTFPFFFFSLSLPSLQ